jgi:DNA-binding MarR family transcriptional regulator
MDALTPDNCTCFNLRKAARVVTQVYDEALKPAGLRATQFSLLTVVAKIGAVGVTALADVMVMDRTTLTRNLRPLIARGLLEVAAGADRRRRPIALTTAGREALERALPLWRDVQARTIARLGHENWAELRRGLSAASTLGA